MTKGFGRGARRHGVAAAQDEGTRRLPEALGPPSRAVSSRGGRCAAALTRRTRGGGRGSARRASRAAEWGPGLGSSGRLSASALSRVKVRVVVMALEVARRMTRTRKRNMNLPYQLE